MRKLKARYAKKPLLTLTRSHQWNARMVYLLVANKFIHYRHGRSKILYIGTTKNGAGRPAASAVNKASEVFYKKKRYGVKTIEVHIVTCAPRKAMQTWKRLEAALIEAFSDKYYQLPACNKVRPKARPDLFSTNALRKILAEFDSRKK